MLEVDDRLLFAATVLHDIGLRAGVTSPDRFEVDGADCAAEFLRAHAFDEREIDVVREAIALHTSPGIAERRGAIAMLTRQGYRAIQSPVSWPASVQPRHT